MFFLILPTFENEFVLVLQTVQDMIRGLSGSTLYANVIRNQKPDNEVSGFTDCVFML